MERERVKMGSDARGGGDFDYSCARYCNFLADTGESRLRLVLNLSQASYESSETIVVCGAHENAINEKQEKVRACFYNVSCGCA